MLERLSFFKDNNCKRILLNYIGCAMCCCSKKKE